MKKYLRVEMPDGSKWDVPANIIADDRAKHYAYNDSPVGATEESEEYKSIYAQEYQYTLDSSYELKDWAANNMDWRQVVGSAVLVSHAPVDFQEGWVNGEKEIIEK